MHSGQDAISSIYSIVEEDTSGILAIALALGASGHMFEFQSSVRRVLCRKLKLVSYMHLDLAAKDSKRVVVKAFRFDLPQHHILVNVGKGCPR